MTYNSEKLVPLDWNQLPLDYTWKDVVVKFDVTVTTKSLSLNSISEDQKDRENRKMDTDVQIGPMSFYLNMK